MKGLGRGLDHCFALGIERDDGDRIPVSGVPCPTPRVFCPCVLVERMACLQDGPVLSGMSLRRTDVADGTVAVVVVVPLHERTRPFSRLIEVREALRRELRPVFCGAEQRFNEGVVVADARAGVRGPQPQPMHHGQHRGCLERRAVIPVQHRLAIERVQVLGESRATQQVHSMLGVVGLVDLEADDLAAVQVQDQVQIEPTTHYRRRQVRHVPAKDLARRGGHVGAWRTGSLGRFGATAMASLSMGPQHACPRASHFPRISWSDKRLAGQSGVSGAVHC